MRPLGQFRRLRRGQAAAARPAPVRSRPRPAGLDPVNVALVIPRSGPAGMFGPSCELSARLAAEELNAAVGAGGRPVRLLTVDGGAAPPQVGERIDRLISTGSVDAVVGWHISAVRRALTPRVRCRVPYVYTALYEGGERSPGVFLTGETPVAQLLPAMRALREGRGVRRWCVVGNDYVWPRQTAAAARGYAQRCGARIAAEAYVPLGTTDFSGVLRRIVRCRADAVLVLLVGADAAAFNRAFAAAGLHDRALRLSTLMDETMLLASGPEATVGLWSAAGYFETLATAPSLGFGARYARRFGVQAPPVGSPGESCYEGILLLAALLGGDGAGGPRGRRRAPRIAGYEGARGALRLRGNHVEQPVYLAEADGLDFHVRTQLLSGGTTPRTPRCAPDPADLIGRAAGGGDCCSPGRRPPAPPGARPILRILSGARLAGVTVAARGPPCPLVRAWSSAAGGRPPVPPVRGWSFGACRVRGWRGDTGI